MRCLNQRAPTPEAFYTKRLLQQNVNKPYFLHQRAFAILLLRKKTFTREKVNKQNPLHQKPATPAAIWTKNLYTNSLYSWYTMGIAHQRAFHQKTGLQSAIVDWQNTLRLRDSGVGDHLCISSCCCWLWRSSLEHVLWKNPLPRVRKKSLEAVKAVVAEVVKMLPATSWARSCQRKNTWHVCKIFSIGGITSQQVVAQLPKTHAPKGSKRWKSMSGWKFLHGRGVQRCSLKKTEEFTLSLQWFSDSFASK